MKNGMYVGVYVRVRECACKCWSVCECAFDESITSKKKERKNQRIC